MANTRSSQSQGDQGCALFAGQGPHFLRGIEVYKGRALFYSLGNFIFQNEIVLWLPDEAYRRFKLGHDQTPGDYLDPRSGVGAAPSPPIRCFDCSPFLPHCPTPRRPAGWRASTRAWR